MASPTDYDEDEQYVSSQDSDFAPDEVPAHESGDTDSDEEPRQDDRAKSKRRRSDAEEGYNNSGDETIIQKGRKRQKRATKNDDVYYDGGEGGLIKTRRQRAEEKAERQLTTTIGPVTVDVDALWEQMKSGKPIPPHDEQPAKEDEPVDDSTKRESLVPSHEADTMVIKRTYNFAGRIHSEDKIVARDSAEGRLYLATRTTKDENNNSNNNNESDNPSPRPKTRKAFRSAFEPILDNTNSTPRTDLDLGLAARRKAAQDAQAKKLNTVEKSRMDWAGYVDREGIQDELALASKSKDSYNARQAFLARSEAIRHDEAKKVRTVNRKN